MGNLSRLDPSASGRCRFQALGRKFVAIKLQSEWSITALIKDGNDGSPKHTFHICFMLPSKPSDFQVTFSKLRLWPRQKNATSKRARPKGSVESWPKPQSIHGLLFGKHNRNQTDFFWCLKLQKRLFLKFEVWHFLVEVWSISSLRIIWQDLKHWFEKLLVSVKWSMSTLL